MTACPPNVYLNTWSRHLGEVPDTLVLHSVSNDWADVAIKKNYRSFGLFMGKLTNWVDL